MVKKADINCLLLFIRDTSILDSNESILSGYRKKWAVGDQKGLNLVTHGDGLTSNCIVRFNVFLVCQMYQFQLELLVDDTTGLEFGSCIMP